ncbi:hypothetical protein J2X54_004855 [Duganella sp. 3397]|uniref:hypothetical protein n=1 Tax=Duganella sp. 3397 TaxID=2817732 RepID=UPI00285AA59F|nr:hypothetical protein [Duganella sp. 3397]MDR7052350.1 hypothetical protein [Duganella sp. 3397]
MATSKRSANPSPTGKPPVPFTATAYGGKPLPPLAAPARTSSPTLQPTAQPTMQPPAQPTMQRTTPPAGAISLSTLLMIGADRVIIDPAEDDDLHFMAEYIDPA